MAAFLSLLTQFRYWLADIQYNTTGAYGILKQTGDSNIYGPDIPLLNLEVAYETRKKQYISWMSR